LEDLGFKAGSIIIFEQHISGKLGESLPVAPPKPETEEEKEARLEREKERERERKYESQFKADLVSQNYS